MAGRSGGTPIRTRKVTPGYDQAFTLPKGTSGAPIKQVALGGKFNTKALNKKLPKPTKKRPKMPTSDKVAIGTAAGLGAGELGLVDKTAKAVDKVVHKTKKIFKKPKSDLGSPGDRKGYPLE